VTYRLPHALHPPWFVLSITTAIGLLVSAAHAEQAADHQLIETPGLVQRVEEGTLPPIGARLPDEPLFVMFTNPEREAGLHGGEIRTLINRPKDIRFMVVYGYARLVRYREDLAMEPDILRSFDVSEDQTTFTLHLRKGHRWSDGYPFTAEDFRYFWEDIASNEELSPSGPPSDLLVEGLPPTVSYPDEHTIIYRWPKPHPKFPSLLAAPRPIFIYRPAHYLKQFHSKYGNEETIASLIVNEKVRNWAALHNRRDAMYAFDNIEQPTLQPWRPQTPQPATRFIMARNPFFHRVTGQGRQLPYIDRWIFSLSESNLIPAKTISGEADLQARGLTFRDITSLKSGEMRNDYTTFLWPIGQGSNFALYPNMTTNDPAWRNLFRRPDFRRALSLGINRDEINKTLFFDLALEVNNTALPQSPLFSEDNQHLWAEFDLTQANELLDNAGLTQRNSNGVRLLPDGRPLEIIVETAGERAEEEDLLALITESWAELGIKLLPRIYTRDVLRRRNYAGATLMTLWSGWNNGIPTPYTSPDELAPVQQTNFAWPKWGQYIQTKGQSGEAIDIPIAEHLLSLYHRWPLAKSTTERRDIWREMLRIHADQQFIIGVVSGVGQPVAVNQQLRNVPNKGIYSWNPGAYFGIYRPEEFWFDRPPVTKKSVPQP